MRHPTVTSAELLNVDALRALVDELVEAKLAALGVVATEYTTASPPPGKTARTFGRWCREGRVEGAVRDGSGWRCTVAAWRSARAAGPKPGAGRNGAGKFTSDGAVTKAANGGEIDLDAMLAGAGLRATR